MIFSKVWGHSTKYQRSWGHLPLFLPVPWSAASRMVYKFIPSQLAHFTGAVLLAVLDVIECKFLFLFLLDFTAAIP